MRYRKGIEIKRNTDTDIEGNREMIAKDAVLKRLK